MADKVKSSSTNVRTEAIILDETAEEELIRDAVIRLNGSILGIVLGIIAGLTIFVATNWLIIKGGNNVGSHLILLSQFFIGYSVTFVGSLIGAIYGFAAGFIGGFMIAWIYNRVIIIKQGN